jgi:hypothetical protein
VPEDEAVVAALDAGDDQGLYRGILAGGFTFPDHVPPAAQDFITTVGRPILDNGEGFCTNPSRHLW